MKNRFSRAERANPPVHVLSHTLPERWPQPLERVWALVCEVVCDLQKDFGIRTHAFVLMTNHYHWLCSYDPELDEDIFQCFHSVLNFALLCGASIDDPTYEILGPSPEVIRLDPFPFYESTYRYVYANPLKAGVVRRVEKYPFSTLPWVLGLSPPQFPIIDNMHITYDAPRTLRWLNQMPLEEGGGRSPADLLHYVV
jgi:hypothetical protein